MARFADALNEQVAYEFGASQQYVAIAVHYDAQTLPQLAAHFYRQAVEERNHAMMIVQYLLDADLPVRVPGVEAPQVEFGDAVEPVRLALEQEQRVTGQISDLVKLAREEGDLVGEQFLHWFLQEQREEVSSMSALLDVVSGELVLDEDTGETVLRAGDAAAWKAGVAVAHRLVNRSGADATYLIVGTRAARDVRHFPDHGATAVEERTEGRPTVRYFRADGSPIEES